MMPWALLLNPTILLGLALAGASAFGWLQTTRLGTAQNSLAALRAEYAGFKAEVVRLGKKAQEKAETQRQADIQRAKESDNEAKKRFAGLDAAYAAYRLRQRSSNRATSSLLPALAPGATVDPRRCYTAESLDRELTGALERFRGRLADSIQPYDQAAITARTCRDWALRLQ